MKRDTILESFYIQDNVCEIAKNLLGKELFVRNDGGYHSGIITETEAYSGVGDKASHAYGNRRTKRTEVMYCKGGVAYVYLCYGMHHLFNVVANVAGIPDAVLIRSVLPGKNLWTGDFEKDVVKGKGPGKLSRLLGIGIQHNGISLTGDEVFITETTISIADDMIVSDKRIGVDYAGEDALLPYRFYIKTEYLKNLIDIQ